jgi:hypothetical protein
VHRQRLCCADLSPHPQSSSFLNRVRRVRACWSALSLPKPSKRRGTKRDNVHDNDNKQHPPPSHHIRHFRFDLIPRVLVRKGEIQHRYEPCLGRPFELSVVLALGVGSDRCANGLVRGLICYDEDKYEGAESEEDSKELEHKEGCDRLQWSLSSC